jgi:CRISPR system Cascade subunit CasC
MPILQFHCLHDRGPNVLNRDDTGAPKQVTIGGTTRQRVSSQCSKNALRERLQMEKDLAGRFGVRTKWMAHEVEQHLISKDVDTALAASIGRDLASHYGAMEPETKAALRSTTLTFLSPAEQRGALEIAEQIASGKLVRPTKPEKKEQPEKKGNQKRGKKEKNDPWLPLDQLLKKTDGAVDIALFGRMLADHKEYSIEAAARFSHAFTVTPAAIIDDWFSAQDHLIQESEDETGAGHLDVQKFGAGVFYQYASVDTDQLVGNLGGKKQLALALTATLALAAGLVTVTPSAKGASFAADSYASYLLVEAGFDAARTLGGAFTDPVRGSDVVSRSIAALRAYRKHLAACYGPWGVCSTELVATPTEHGGSLEEVLRFCAAAFRLQRPEGSSLIARIAAEEAISA